MSGSARTSCTLIAACAMGVMTSLPAVGEPSGARLAWVNPARCLTECASDPKGVMLRLDDRGRPSARGKHRVEEAAAAALDALLSAARDAGFKLRVNSAFRSYREQARVFR